MNREELEKFQMDESLQQQQLDAQQSMYAPQVMEQMQQGQAVLVEKTNPKNTVNEIILRLRGLEILPDGTTKKISEPKMNKEGIDNIWYILDSHINQNVILSHLDNREIAHIMHVLQEDVVDDLSLNWKRYGITKKTDLDIINNSVLINIFLSLKRAEGQNEKNWLKGISFENISGGNRLQSGKKEGFFSKFRL